MDRTCERCLRPDLEMLTLYLGLVQEASVMNVIPLTGLTLKGGKLEICTECYGEWLAATKTWFENPTTLRAVPKEPQ